MLHLQLSSEVIEQSIDSIEGEHPSFVHAGVTRIELVNEIEHRLTIDLKKVLAQGNAFRAAVPFNFTFIRIELRPPNAVVRKKWGQSILE